MFDIFVKTKTGNQVVKTCPTYKDAEKYVKMLRKTGEDRQIAICIKELPKKDSYFD